MDRKLIAVAVATALGMSATAQAVEFSVSGKVNRAIASVDTGSMDDGDGDLTHVESGFGGGTRFRFTGSEELENGMTVGVRTEFGVGSDVGRRHADVHVSGEFGKLSIGHTSTVTDGSPYATLVSTGHGGVTQSCAYTPKAVNDALAVCKTFGGGRRGVLRYDSPSLGPAKISAAISDNDYWDAGLELGGMAGETEYKLRVGYRAKTDTSETTAAVSGTPAGEPMMEHQYLLGSELLTALRMENPSDPVGATDRNGDNPFFEDNGEESTSVTNTDAADAIMDHAANAVEMNPDVTDVKIDQIGTEGNVDASSYRKIITRVEPAKEGTPAKTTVKEEGDAVIVSGSVKLASGTSVAVAWGDEKTSDSQYLFVALDQSYGDGSVGIYTKRGTQTVMGKDHDSSFYGVGLAHDVGGGAKVFAGYRVMKADMMQDNIKITFAGMQVTFN